MTHTDINIIFEGISGTVATGQEDAQGRKDSFDPERKRNSIKS